MMNDKAFENKVNRDVEKAKKDISALGDDGAEGLSRKFEKLEDDLKTMVAEAAKSLNGGVGQGLSQFNNKVQDFADRVPGDFGKKVASYPWVTITTSLAIGLLLGVLLKPGRQAVE